MRRWAVIVIASLVGACAPDRTAHGTGGAATSPDANDDVTRGSTSGLPEVATAWVEEDGSSTAVDDTTGGGSGDPDPGDDNDHDGAAGSDDCHDFHPGVHPAAPEVRDGFDNDCDGDVDEGFPASTAYEGYGAGTVGGAGGDVYHVTTLADAGPGSLRAGIEARSGPRIIVFDTPGEITLLSDIVIDAPFITIDGASAPAPGITIRKPELEVGAFVVGGTHDVVVSHVRFVGVYVDGVPDGTPAATITIDGTRGPDAAARNIVFDHIVSRNATDAGPNIWGEVSDVTISHSVFFESWHPTAISHVGPELYTRRRISLHHNLYARNDDRNPQVRGDVRALDYVNNTIYDWGGHGGGATGYGVRIRNEPGEPQVEANIVGNAFFPTRRPEWALVFGVAPGPDETDAQMGALWIEGNLLPAENLDHTSTATARLIVPDEAEVRRFDAADLGRAVLPWVGTHHRDADEQDLIDEVAPRFSI